MVMALRNGSGKLKTIAVDEEVWRKLRELKFDYRVESFNDVLRRLLGLPVDADRPSSAVAGEDLSDVPVSP